MDLLCEFYSLFTNVLHYMITQIYKWNLSVIMEVHFEAGMASEVLIGFRYLHSFVEKNIGLDYIIAF